MNRLRDVLIPFGVTLVVIGLVVAAVLGIESLPDERQSGQPVAADPQRRTITGPGVGMTTYCLTDGSGMRVYERPFPMGGTQPLFSVVWTGGLQPGNPARCP